MSASNAIASGSSSSNSITNIAVTPVYPPADLATIRIRRRVKLAESRLPPGSDPGDITIEKQAPSQLMTLLDVRRSKFDEISGVHTRSKHVGRIAPYPGRRPCRIGSRCSDEILGVWIQFGNIGIDGKLQDDCPRRPVGIGGGQTGYNKPASTDVDVTLPITAPVILKNLRISWCGRAGGSIIRIGDLAVSLEAPLSYHRVGSTGKHALSDIYMLPGCLDALEESVQKVKRGSEIYHRTSRKAWV